jgi:hypothetical protein
MPEDMPDRMPEDLPDRMPEDMQEDVPDRMPNRLSEDMSDRMLEDLPVRKCRNVMVGTIRSEVILLEGTSYLPMISPLANHPPTPPVSCPHVLRSQHRTTVSRRPEGRVEVGNMYIYICAAYEI